MPLTPPSYCHPPSLEKEKREKRKEKRHKTKDIGCRYQPRVTSSGSDSHRSFHPHCAIRLHLHEQHDWMFLRIDKERDIIRPPRRFSMRIPPEHIESRRQRPRGSIRSVMKMIEHREGLVASAMFRFESITKSLPRTRIDSTWVKRRTPVDDDGR